MKRLNNRVAIVTGAGGGLGREHALFLARMGARVVVNDVLSPAGGAASQTLARWGRVDILVNNAGILRDKTFSKMDIAEFREVIEVHLMGSVNCTKAVWEAMRVQRYGRVVMTTSSSGLFGNFGQSNYAAAKMALVGLAQTLALEGEKYNIKVNCLAPTAATRMLEGLLGADALAALSPAAASAALGLLVAEDAPTRMVLAQALAASRPRTSLSREAFFSAQTTASRTVWRAASRKSLIAWATPCRAAERPKSNWNWARRGFTDLSSNDPLDLGELCNKTRRLSGSSNGVSS